MRLPQRHTETQIHQDWQQATEIALEAGRPPLLELGMSRHLPASIPVVLTLAAWRATRTDPTQPVMVTGGVDALWPVPFCYLSETVKNEGDETACAPVQFVYGGANQATYLATLTTQAEQRLQAATFYAVDLPASMQPLVASHSQPHVYATWQTLPLTLLQEASLDAATYSSNATLQPAAGKLPAATDPWLVWLSLLIVVVLVLLALFV